MKKMTKRLPAACLGVFVGVALLSILQGQTQTPTEPRAGVGKVVSAASGRFDTTELRAEIAQNVALLAEALRKGGPAGHDPSTLVRIQRAYLDALLAYAGDSDPEVHARVSDVLDKVVLKARIKRILARLPDDQRKKFLGFQKAHPQLLEDILSADLPIRIKAAKMLAKLTDPDGLAEPLLAMCLRHPSREIVNAALEAADSGKYKSDLLVDALTAVLLRFQGQDSYRYGPWGNSDQPLPDMLALNAIRTIGGTRAAPTLLTMLLNQRGYDYDGKGVILAEALGATKEKRAIPVLLKKLGSPGGYRTRRWGEGGKITSTSSDLFLLALVRLTDQPAGSYKFIRHEGSPGWSLFGFANKADRKAAIGKFRKWWAEHEDLPEYRDLEPLEIPSLRQTGAYAPRTRPTATTTPAKAQSRPAATRPSPAAPPVDELCLRVGRRVSLLVDAFRSNRLKDRRSAQAELLAVEESYLAGLAKQAKQGENQHRKLMASALTDAVVESRIARTLAKLDADWRSELQKFRQAHPETTRDLFSLSWSRTYKALGQLAEMTDFDSAAEHLIIGCLSHASLHVQVAAAKAAGKRKFRSDKLVDILCGIIIANRKKTWQPHWRHSSMPQIHIEALVALKEIASPRAAPVLLALLGESEDRNMHKQMALAEALAATGEKRAIEPLIKYLDRTESFGNMSWGDKLTITVAESDAALMALVKLTGQDPKDYDFVTYPYQELPGIGKPHGFKDAASRKAAIKKFNDFWAAHGQDPPYRDLKPLPIPMLPKSPEKGIPRIGP